MSARILTLFDQDFAPEPVKEQPVEKEDKDEIPFLRSADEQAAPVIAPIFEEFVEPEMANQEAPDILFDLPEIPFNTNEPNDVPEAVINTSEDDIENTDKQAAINNNVNVEIDAIYVNPGKPEATINSEENTESTIKPKKKRKKEPNEEEVNTTIPANWEGEKHYYSIGEVADLFKVNTSHIRFWTNEFNLKVRTTRKGDRLYTKDQIQELRTIHHLVKERGFTLTGAKAKLKEQNKRDIKTVDLKTSLIQLRGKLATIRKQLI